MADPDKPQTKLVDELRAIMEARSYIRWTMPGLQSNCCQASVIATNVTTPTGRIADVAFTANSKLLCSKCGAVMDENPLATATGHAPTPDTPHPTPAQQHPCGFPQLEPSSPTDQPPTTDSLTHPLEWNALVKRVVDADTYDALLDVGFHIQTTQRIRLARVDAPERHTPEGQEATVMVRLLIEGKTCRVRTYSQRDKYGRHVADVWAPNGESIADFLRANNLIKPEAKT